MLSNSQASGNSCRKEKKKSRFGKCAGFSNGKGKEFFLSKQRDIHDFLERKAENAFEGECAAQTRLSEAQSGLDRREWRMQNAGSALGEINRHAAPVPEDGTLSGESIDWSDSKRRELATWRISDEKQCFSGRSSKKLLRNCRITENMLYRSWKSSTIEEWWTFYAEGRK